MRFSAKDLNFDRDRNSASKTLAEFLLNDPIRGQGYLDLAKYQYSSVRFLSMLDEYDMDIISAVARLGPDRQKAWQSVVDWLKKRGTTRHRHFFSLALTWGLENQDNEWLLDLWSTGSDEIHHHLSDIVPFAVSKFPLMPALFPVADILISRIVDPKAGKHPKLKALLDLEHMFQWAGAVLLDHINPVMQARLLDVLAKLPELEYPALRSLVLRSRLGKLAHHSQSVSRVPEM